MGIVKIRHRGPGNNIHAQQSLKCSTHGDPVNDSRSLLENSTGDDFDDYECGDSGCELAMVGDQMCSVPYELYSLSDLTEILSLETWNSCLTEEDRFSLAAYLPDVDQETFWLMMKDLLSGENVFFGSPLERLFHRLKGGFYSIDVAQFREGLRLLQRRGYYHSLRSYHERMVQTFEDMKRTWSTLQSSVNAEERVQIWKRKNQKPVLLVDLNVPPADEETLCKGEKKLTTMPLLPAIKYMTSKGENAIVPPQTMNSVTMNTKAKAKGVLKIKPVDMNVTQSHMVQPLQSNSWESSRRPPKGVLKIKPKTELLGQQGSSLTFPGPLEQISTDFLGVHQSSFSPPRFTTNRHQDKIPQGLAFLRQTVKDETSYRSHELPDLLNNQQKENFLHMGVDGLPPNSQSSQRIVNTVTHRSLHNPTKMQQEIVPMKSRLRDYYDGSIVRQNAGLHSRVFCESSTESYPFVSEHCQERRQMKNVGSSVSEITPGNSATGSKKHHSSLDSSVHLGDQHLEHSNEIKRSPVQISTSDNQTEGLMFPITYKRKKPFRKMNSSDAHKQPTIIPNLEPNVSAGDGRLIEKTRTLKIRIKGLNDHNTHHNTQYKQGMLNGHDITVLPPKEL